MISKAGKIWLKIRRVRKERNIRFTWLVGEPVYIPRFAPSGCGGDGQDPFRVFGATSEYGHKQLEAVPQILRPTPVPIFLPWKILFPAESPEGTTDQILVEIVRGHARRISQYEPGNQFPSPPQRSIDLAFLAEDFFRSA